MTPPLRGRPGKLSAIVMIKDEEEYVGHAILSMLPHVDEMVVVDGGSADGTHEIVRMIRHEFDRERKIRFWVDERPKNELIHTRNEMIAACTGEWILRLEGDEVYDDRNAVAVARLLKSEALDPSLMSVGWPYWFFVDDLQTMVEIGEPHTAATIAVRNVEGLHAAHHDRGGNETFWDEGWFDVDGKEVSVHHPRDNPTAFTHRIGVHHYAAFKRTSRHREYAVKARKVPFLGGHPEVFWRHDFRPWMIDPEFADPSRRDALPASVQPAPTYPVAADAGPGGV